jgi:hypothetical protein
MPITISSVRRSCLVASCLALAVPRLGAQPDVDLLISRVGDRIAEFYKRAQTVVFTEKSTVQPIGLDFSPRGFARTVESELHVEMEGDSDGQSEATVVRQIKRVNGRPPRERDKKDRAGCTDPNPLSTEPLSFLLPGHRSEYRFTRAGVGADRNRSVVMIDFKSIARGGKLELKEDERGHDDCFDWSGDVAVKGRIWVDTVNYDVLRVNRQIGGPVDIKVPAALQRRHNLDMRMVIERDDLTIRYKTVAFREPDELVLVPESIEALTVLRGGLESTRRTQTYTDFRRFLTGGRLVK